MDSVIIIFFCLFLLCSSAPRRNRLRRCVRSIHFILILIRQRAGESGIAAAGKCALRASITKTHVHSACQHRHVPQHIKQHVSFLSASRLCSNMCVPLRVACGCWFSLAPVSRSESIAKNKRHFRPERVARVSYLCRPKLARNSRYKENRYQICDFAYVIYCECRT